MQSRCKLEAAWQHPFFQVALCFGIGVKTRRLLHRLDKERAFRNHLRAFAFPFQATGGCRIFRRPNSLQPALHPPAIGALFVEDAVRRGALVDHKYALRLVDGAELTSLGDFFLDLAVLICAELQPCFESVFRTRFCEHRKYQPKQQCKRRQSTAIDGQSRQGFPASAVPKKAPASRCNTIPRL